LLPAVLAACTPAPTQQVPAEFQAGQNLFHRVCSNCHGSDAMGGETKAPKLIDAEFLPPDFTDDDIRDTIINGSSSGKMPPQRASFSAEQISQIIAYLRYSQKAAGLSSEPEEGIEDSVMAEDEFTEESANEDLEDQDQSPEPETGTQT